MSSSTPLFFIDRQGAAPKNKNKNKQRNKKSIDNHKNNHSAESADPPLVVKIDEDRDDDADDDIEDINTIQQSFSHIVDENNHSNTAAPSSSPSTSRPKRRRSRNITSNITSRFNKEQENKTAVWHDEDDYENEQVDLLEVPRRKKLRKQTTERVISGIEYSKRMQIMHAEKQINRGQGTWAQLDDYDNINKKRRKRNFGVDDDNDDDDDDFDDDDNDDTNQDEEEEDDTTKKLSKQVDSLMQSAGTLAKSSRDKKYNKKSVLTAGILDIQMVKSANVEERSACEPRCIDFHPTGRLLLTAGNDKSVRIFHVDGVKNNHLQTVHIRNFPITSAAFTGGGSRVVATSRRRHLHSIDLETGTVSSVHSFAHLAKFDTSSKSSSPSGWERMICSHDGQKLALASEGDSNVGRIIIACEKSMRSIDEIRLNSKVAGMQFAAPSSSSVTTSNDYNQSNEHELYTSDRNGMVYIWDLRSTNRCIDMHRDEGAIHSTTIATSPTHYVCGSDSGVVNVYTRNANSLFSSSTGSSSAYRATRTRVPEKALMSLRTPIHQTRFNHDGKLMAFSSHDKSGAIRIAHIPSMTVFSNWPTSKARLHRVCSMAFSPGGGFLAVGDSPGDVRLYRIRAYPPS